GAATSQLSGRCRLQRRSWMVQPSPVHASRRDPTSCSLDELHFSAYQSASQLTSLLHGNNHGRSLAIHHHLEFRRRSDKHWNYSHPYLHYRSIVYSNRNSDGLIYSSTDLNQFSICNRLH